MGQRAIETCSVLEQTEQEGVALTFNETVLAL